MPQKHVATEGTFHITTNAHGKIPWCTWPGVPEILIDNLVMTKNLHKAQVYAFCIMPDHVHFIVYPGEKGLSKFMHSFKRNSSKDVNLFLQDRSGNRTRATIYGDIGIARSRGSATPAVKKVRWQNGYYDELIHDNRQRTAAMNYVMFNPLKHHLVDDIDHWPWTSYHFQERVDPLEIWFV